MSWRGVTAADRAAATSTGGLDKVKSRWREAIGFSDLSAYERREDVCELPRNFLSEGVLVKVFARSHLKGEEPVIGGAEDRIPTPQGRGGSVSRRDHNQVNWRATTSQAEPLMQKRATQAPTALRERGSGGEALLSEKRPLPQNLHNIVFVFPGGSAREGAFLQKGALPRKILRLFSLHQLAADVKGALVAVEAAVGEGVAEGAELGADLLTGEDLYVVVQTEVPQGVILHAVNAQRVAAPVHVLRVVDVVIHVQVSILRECGWPL